MKNSFKQVYSKCSKLYDKIGPSAVYDYCNKLKPIIYSHCKGCEEETPSHIHEEKICLICASQKK